MAQMQTNCTIRRNKDYFSMLSKRKRTSYLLLISLLTAFILTSLAPVSIAYAADQAQQNAAKNANPVPKKQGLIVYNDVKHQATARVIWNLTGHFNIDARIMSQDQVTAEALEGINYLFAISERGEADFAKLRALAEPFSIRMMWVGGDTGTIGMQKMNIIDATYMGQKHPMRNHMIAPISPPSTSEVQITASNGNDVYPLGYSDDREWGFASTQLLDKIGLIFADWLHLFFGEPHIQGHEAFIRIEDVSPTTDPDKLKAIADLLSERDIPFMIATIPLYVNPDTGKKMSLRDQPKVVEALQYAVAHGASIVMHGYTHQYYQSETGEGFEFWDAENDQPVPNEELYTEEKLERGIALLMDLGLYPLAFEPPHYTMSQRGYQIANRYFSTMVASVQLTDSTYAISQAIPYRSRYQSDGMNIIPETLGYVEEDPGHVPLMLTRMNDLKIVRDSLFSAFYHTTISIDLLRELVDGLQKQHVSFIDLKKESHSVRTDFASIQLNDGQIIPKITNQDKFEIASESGTHKPSSQPKWLTNFSFFFTWGIAIVVGIFILLFILFMILLKKRKKYRLFQEEDSSNDR
ncbi:polysaccharide deacetylase family protein [Paenibacillus radicibacter]|uniref:polysaccharide deacetylase family protein n=1 Tax=Paenibacillus radicibacter TaxID=2972488 RepID=UPI0021590C25|nr:polysaccharide deacetylase family protein [Paenibacillus radicibacter]